MDTPELKTVARFFAAIESKDTEAVADLYADDVQVWHNFTRACMDKAANVQTLKAMCEHVPRVRYDVEERIQLADGRVLQRHVLRATTPAGDEILMPACIFITVRDGRVARIDEYLDTGQANRMRAATGRPLIVSA